MVGQVISYAYLPKGHVKLSVIDCILLGENELYVRQVILTAGNLNSLMSSPQDEVRGHMFPTLKVHISIPGPVSCCGHGSYDATFFHASYSLSGPQLPKGC